MMQLKIWNLFLYTLCLWLDTNVNKIFEMTIVFKLYKLVPLNTIAFQIFYCYFLIIFTMNNLIHNIVIKSNCSELNI